MQALLTDAMSLFDYFDEAGVKYDGSKKSEVVELVRVIKDQVTSLLEGLEDLKYASLQCVNFMEN